MTSLLLQILVTFAVGFAAPTQKPVDVLMKHETYVVRDGGDPDKLAGDTTTQGKKYRPENAIPFIIKTYWVPAGQMDIFEGQNLPTEIRRLFFKTEGNENLVLFPVHPESENYFYEITKGKNRGPDFQAKATSSGRTVLVTTPAVPGYQFFAKLSLDRILGDVHRTIKNKEIARSLGTNNLLAQIEENRGRSPMTRFSEVLGIMPHGMERGGLLIRSLPQDLLKGKGDTYIPAFSIYGNRPDGQIPLAAEQIANSGLTPLEWVRQQILIPFAKEWVRLAVLEGLSLESHAQNFLIRRTADGEVGGAFAYRDFGGFTIDIDHRKAMGLELPQDLPFYGSLKSTYHHHEFQSNLITHLSMYFVGGFLYDLDNRIPRWHKQGWISQGLPSPTAVQDQFRMELGWALADLSGTRGVIWKDYRNLPKLVLEARKKLKKYIQKLPCYDLMEALST